MIKADKIKAAKGDGEADLTFDMWLRSKKQMKKKKEDELREYNVRPPPTHIHNRSKILNASVKQICTISDKCLLTFWR